MRRWPGSSLIWIWLVACSVPSHNLSHDDFSPVNFHEKNIEINQFSSAKLHVYRLQFAAIFSTEGKMEKVLMSYLSSPLCCIYASVNWVSIYSDNGLSPGRHQAIIWTTVGTSLIGPLWTNFSENRIEIKTLFIHENAFETVVCEMVAILRRGRRTNEVFREKSCQY